MGGHDHETVLTGHTGHMHGEHDYGEWEMGQDIEEMCMVSMVMGNG